LECPGLILIRKVNLSSVVIEKVVGEENFRELKKESVQFCTYDMSNRHSSTIQKRGIVGRQTFENKYPVFIAIRTDQIIRKVNVNYNTSRRETEFGTTLTLTNLEGKSERQTEQPVRQLAQLTFWVRREGRWIQQQSYGYIFPRNDFTSISMKIPGKYASMVLKTG
jgi:hypothetical protein